MVIKDKHLLRTADVNKYKVKGSGRNDGEQYIEEDIADEQEMYEHFRFTADKGQTPLRIDKFLFDRMSGTSRNRIQNAAAAGSILVDDNPVKSNYKVRPGDIISIVLPHPPRDKEIYPENIPLNIIYEDNDLLIVNKAAGMVVHPGFGNFTGTLVHALYYHLQTMPLLVHRIDKDTSGLLLVAKNEIAQTFLAKQFFDHTTERTYQALVWGDIEEPEGTIIGNIDRSAKDRKIMAVYPDGDKGKHAVTHYKVIERFGYVTLFECRLETGRTHQIRAHFKYIKHPLFADEAYGGMEIIKGTVFTRYKQFVENCFSIMPRQALHAKTLGFIHPTKKEKIIFDSELPQDMAQVIDKWRGKHI
jgi:23S rRNA pseudouridine1911/1915/1917 synthase